MTVVGIYPPGDETAQRHLLQLGIDTNISADASAEVIQEALDGLDASSAEPGSGQAWVPQGLGAEDGGGPDGLTTPALHGGSRPLAPDQPGTAGDAEGEEQLGAIIAVWGPAGAPGRTTVALNLASELALLGQPTVLVDADTYGGCIAQALSLLDEAPGLAAATRSADQGSLDLAALARLAPEVSPGLRVLTGIPKAERWPELRAAALEHVLTLTRRLARFTVIDCGFSLEDDEELSYDTLAPRRNAATLTSLAVADQVLGRRGRRPDRAATTRARAAGAGHRRQPFAYRRHQQGAVLRCGSATGVTHPRCAHPLRRDRRPAVHPRRPRQPGWRAPGRAVAGRGCARLRGAQDSCGARQ